VYLIYCKNCPGNWSGSFCLAGLSGGLRPAGFVRRASSGGLRPAGFGPAGFVWQVLSGGFRPAQV